MALTPTIQVSGANLLASVDAKSVSVRASSLNSLIAANFPTFSVRLSGAVVPVAAAHSSPMKVSGTNVLVAAKGRTADPHLRAWTFTLDGHDFYVLRLGDKETLIYDTTTQQWVEWGDLNSPFWRPNVGQNWVGGSRLGLNYGSDIIAGDDTFGLLWVLNPEQPYDDHPDELSPDREVYFDRAVTGQISIRGRTTTPVYAAFITSDMGNPAYEGAGVTLYISDDAGKTYEDMGLVTVTQDYGEPELSWYSLGQMEAPGRLFKIVDDGAITRIDGLEIDVDGAGKDAG